MAEGIRCLPFNPKVKRTEFSFLFSIREFTRFSMVVRTWVAKRRRACSSSVLARISSEIKSQVGELTSIIRPRLVVYSRFSGFPQPCYIGRQRKSEMFVSMALNNKTKIISWY